MPSKIRLFTSFSLCLTVVWAALVCFGVQEVRADNAPLYRLQKYKKEPKRVTVYFREATSAGKKVKLVKLRVPLALKSTQILVDGLYSRNKSLFAAMDGEIPSIFEVALNSSKRVVSVEERKPTTADTALFAGLTQGGNAARDGARGSGAISADSRQGSCPAGYIWAQIGTRTEYLKQCLGNKKCIFVPTILPVMGCVPTQSPATQPPPASPQHPTANPPAVTTPSCLDPKDCGKNKVCCAPLVCTDPDLGTCGQGSTAPSGSLTPAPNQAIGSRCSITYSCRYNDGSIGRGTVTCSDNVTSVSGHWGSMDCKNCTKSLSNYCLEGGTAPTDYHGDVPEVSIPSDTGADDSVPNVISDPVSVPLDGGGQAESYPTIDTSPIFILPQPSCPTGGCPNSR
jgi:hypothetical protein